MAEKHDALLAEDVTLEDMHGMIQRLRSEAIVAIDPGPLCGEAESFYYLAVASLEQAQQFMSIAAQRQNRAVCLQRGDMVPP